MANAMLLKCSLEVALVCVRATCISDDSNLYIEHVCMRQEYTTVESYHVMSPHGALQRRRFSQERVASGNGT